MKLRRLLPPAFRRRGEEGAGPVIPVVRLQGLIAAGGSPLRPTLSLATAAPLLQRAFTVKAPVVAISVNSPGGSPVQSRLIFRRIRDLAVEHEREVVVFCEDVAASGGYMIAVAGDHVIADPSSIVGSIGVVSQSFGFVEALERLGVERRVYTSGENKATLDPFLPADPADIEHLKSLQAEVHEVFIELVRERRGLKLADDPNIFTGRFWSGLSAERLGLVDGVGDLRSYLRGRFGEGVKLRPIAPQRGLFGRRTGGLGVGPDMGAERMGAAERIGAGAADGALAALAERAAWSRYGL